MTTQELPRQQGRRGGEQTVVPEADFTSYYGRPVVKPAPWDYRVPAYFFTGGLAAGSSVLAAGASVTGLPALRRNSRLTALVALTASTVLLVTDLGRPARFLNMLRTVKLTSPMSVGTWILSGYAPFAVIAAAGEVSRMLPDPPEDRPSRLRRVARLLRAVDGPAGFGAAVMAPPLAAYTAVLLADTATPSWHEAYRELPFVFVGSAMAAAGGMGMVTTPPDQAGPARRMALGAAVIELVAEQRMERTMGITAEPLQQGKGGRLMRIAKTATVAGALGSLLAGRNRVGAVLSGVALMVGSLCTRLGIVAAGIESAKDPKYTVVPQRERIE